METYIKGNISNITYQSELVPPSCFRKKAGGLIRPNNLRSLAFRKLWAH